MDSRVSVKLSLARECWPVAGAFTISRGSRTSAEVVVATLEANGCRGRGECVPYPRYGESVASVVQALEDRRGTIEAGLTPDAIAALALPKAAANALDCALWDLEAKRTGTPVWRLLGLAEPRPLITALTLSLDSPSAMAAAAARQAHRPLLKLKLGRPGDAERLQAVRLAAPRTRLIVDANEGWQVPELPQLLRLCRDLGIELIEQPLPAAHDDALRGIEREVALCADESSYGRHDLEVLRGKYDAINIKLDKMGGLSEALALKESAVSLGFDVMVGCMLSTSLAMAPAVLVAQGVKYVDLDGPLLLSRDREPPIRFTDGLIHPAPPALWG